MSNLVQILSRAHLVLVRDRSGATAIEYGLLAAGISVAIIATVFFLGTELDAAFQGVLTAIQGAGGGAP